MFDLGRYHATPWGTHVNDASVEWPPSPWRLIRALYSASRTNQRALGRRKAIDRALQALVDAPPPVYSLPAALAGHTRHYMPEAGYSPVATDKTAMVIDAFMAVESGQAVSVWWDQELDPEAAEALAATAVAVGYLGRSESVCSMTVAAAPEPPAGVLVAPLADDRGGEPSQVIDLLCPVAGRPLEEVAISVTRMRDKGLRTPPAAERVAYSLPAEPDTERPKAKSNTSPPDLAMFRLAGGGRPAVTEAVAVGQAVRRGLQSLFGSAEGRSASSTFSGREGEDRRLDQHRHAHYLAAPEGDGRRVDRVYVWAPEGFGQPEIEALARLTFVRLHESPDLQCSLASLGSASQLVLPEILGPSDSWRSLTPFGLVRHPKRRGGRVIDGAEEQVRRELEHRGLPEPVQVSLEKGSWHRYRSSKAGSSRLERASLIGVRVRFSEPVVGPLALGALSHYGLGLLQPEG
jgi:CRISPR-associated protein Csb2